jgi:uncharacterized repeat protein (TIGR01451 family)
VRAGCVFVGPLESHLIQRHQNQSLNPNHGGTSMNSMRLSRIVRPTALLVVGAFAATALAQPAANPRLRVARLAYPTGNMATSVIALERMMPVEVRIGESFEYTVTLTNLTSTRVDDLVLTETLPQGFNVTSITPSANPSADGTVSWALGSLSPRAKTQVRFLGTATSPGELSSCSSVTFKTSACSGLQVVQPALQLVKETPPEVMLCDPIPMRIVVTNTGSGMARNVQVMDELPEGWTTANGKSKIVFNAGNLAAGQSREFTVNLKATRTGDFTNCATAREEGGLTAEDCSSTRIIKPELVLQKSGPNMRYLGRPVQFDITVTNQGDAPARDAVLVDRTPAGSTLVSATQGGQQTQQGVMWNLGTINPGESRQVALTVNPAQLGMLRNMAEVRSECTRAAGEATVEIRGIPAVLLEVIDVDDPIEVGSNETYQIKVFNQGSANDTNIVITCTVPPEQQFVSANGPTPHTVNGQVVTFAALPSLAPRATANYRVVTRGTTAADTRFGVSLTSDQLTRPVQETESTNIY